MILNFPKIQKGTRKSKVGMGGAEGKTLKRQLFHTASVQLPTRLRSHCTLNAPRLEARNPICCVILSSAHSACALQLLQPKFSEPLILLLSLSHFIIENSTGFSSSNNDQHPTAPLPPTHHLCGHRPGGLRYYYLSLFVSVPT